MLRRTCFLVALIGLGSGACSGAPETSSGAPDVDYGEAQEPIIHGTPIPVGGDPATVAIAWFSPATNRWRAYCSGSLINAKTVLSAAHCDSPMGTGVAYGAIIGNFDTREANTDAGYWGEPPPTTAEEIAALPIRVAKIRGVYKHPDYDSAVFGVGDIALMELGAPVDDVLPVELNTDPRVQQTVIGQPIRHVGFGGSEIDPSTGGLSGDGIKREGTNLVVEVDDNGLLLRYGDSSTDVHTCLGDSGGPGFVAKSAITGNPRDTGNVQVGVVSFGVTGCEGTETDVRVDPYISWMTETYADWVTGGCEADGFCMPEGCREPDPDCLGLGASCTKRTQCPARFCVSDPQHADSYCSQSCSATHLCPAGMSCDETTDPQAPVCIHAQQPDVTFGSTTPPTDASGCGIAGGAGSSGARAPGRVAPFALAPLLLLLLSRVGSRVRGKRVRLGTHRSRPPMCRWAWPGRAALLKREARDVVCSTPVP